MGCMAADLDIFVRHRDGMRRGMLQLHIVSVGIAREIESKARLEERIEDGAGCRITADPVVEVETIPGEILNRIIVQTPCPQILDAGSMAITSSMQVPSSTCCAKSVIVSYIFI